MPSDGNSPQLLEGITLFVEMSVGRAVAQGPKDLGASVVWHQEVLADDASDVEYLALCADRGWVPFTGDSDVSTAPLQKILIRRTKLRVIRLTRNHWPQKEKLEAFLAALPAIKSLLRRRPYGPFIARVNREGRISSVEDLPDADAAKKRQSRRQRW
jgi:hypothetical protein